MGGPNDRGVQLGVGGDLLEIRLQVVDVAGAGRGTGLEPFRELLDVGDLVGARRSAAISAASGSSIRRIS